MRTLEFRHWKTSASHGDWKPRDLPFASHQQKRALDGPRPFEDVSTPLDHFPGALSLAGSKMRRSVISEKCFALNVTKAVAFNLSAVQTCRAS